ncbi:lysophospholipid acyltransferase family protein [Jannaschia sp. LMIT008]|uniref:lysophospholipid acyltransferase family protein n=1 Tax=Jannaschia maritima TaxID=3032585 RepID=UPI002810E9BC|nr:lysophospholipid acyltransferase family protein [Jannaschia sp. LMIT008]
MPARLRIARRGGSIITILVLGLGLLLLARLIERPLYGQARPVTPWITVGVCRLSLRILGLSRTVRGDAMDRPGGQVANHVSWLDVLVLNATAPVHFVAKAEVAGWAGIGHLARATGTVFIARRRGEAAKHGAMLRDRLRLRQRLLFFPEGTSTDGLRVLPFKTTLFAAFLGGDLPKGISVQPVALRYHAPRGRDRAFYGWWGDMDLGSHLIRMLAVRRHGRVVVTYGSALDAGAFGGDRKALARTAEAAVREAFDTP